MKPAPIASDQIAEEWRQNAKRLAAWTMAHLVNRTDVWGHYQAAKYRQDPATGQRNNALTLPIASQRGKIFLQVSSLEKHYKSSSGDKVLGVHSTAADLSSRWMAIDVDLHDEDNLSVTPEGNFVAAHGWWSQLVSWGFDPLLLDSNGAGGYHLFLLFAEPMSTRSVNEFAKRLVADYSKRGLDRLPDIFPNSPKRNHYGNWLRLPGRHHTRPHFTRVWNDEPWAEEKWLSGLDAIERMMSTRPAAVELLEQHGIERRRPTICVDFDGVIHSYVSGWCGETAIPDPPIHRAKEAIARLRQQYRVVVHSTRCQSAAGRKAIREWLKKHGIEIDEICRSKPPAMVYLDDRAVPFKGDWDQAVVDINSFRK
jgi:hypothetical protein